MDGLELVRGLISRGYRPYQAAALAGHMLQESGGNPSALNRDEGANGLLQWRLDRWDNLRNFANGQGKSPSDPEVQMDFIRKEMEGPEKKAGAAFMAAPDLESASAALKGYIRFGDKSDAVRLANARGLMGEDGGTPVGKLASAPATETGAPTSLAVPVGQLAAAPTTASILSGLGDKLNPQQQGSAQQSTAPEYAPLQTIQMPQIGGQSSQIAAALARMYGIGA